MDISYIFFLLLVHICDTQIHRVKFLRYSRLQNNGTLLASFTVSSVLQCARQCSVSETCISFQTLFENKFICQLLNVNLSNGSFVVGSTGSYFELKIKDELENTTPIENTTTPMEDTTASKKS